MTEGLRTPLYDEHVRLGGKMVEFGGWLMPIQYSGILEEHRAVRERAGLFDVSHMGEIQLKGPDALRLLQYLITNDADGLAVGQAIYSPMCNAHGGVVDDLLAYKLGEEHYWLVVNAANFHKDLEWVQKHAGDMDVQVNDVAAQTAQLALQGPLAEKILQTLTNVQLGEIKFYHFVPDATVAGTKCLLSRSGYTGEDGFELYVSADGAVALWQAIMDAGRESGLLPCGLGARDLLRFEACLPLYGNELGDDISPLEAGLGMFVKLGKKDKFIGQDALQKQHGAVKRKLAGLVMLKRCVPRHGYEVQCGGKQVGHVTTGSYSPMLDKNVALALIDSQWASLGQQLEVIVRGRPYKAEVAAKPFYRKSYKK